MRGKNLRGNFGCLLNKFIYLILLHFAKAINMNQVGFLASLIFGYLPIRQLADSGFILPKTLLRCCRSRVTVARQPVIFTRFPFSP